MQDDDARYSIERGGDLASLTGVTHRNVNVIALECFQNTFPSRIYNTTDRPILNSTLPVFTSRATRTLAHVKNEDDATWRFYVSDANRVVYSRALLCSTVSEFDTPGMHCARYVRFKRGRNKRTPRQLHASFRESSPRRESHNLSRIAHCYVLEALRPSDALNSALPIFTSRIIRVNTRRRERETKRTRRRLCVHL